MVIFNIKRILVTIILLLSITNLACSDEQIRPEPNVITPKGQSGFKYVPDEQPSREYKKPKNGDNDLFYSDLDGVKARLLNLEEQVDQLQRRNKEITDKLNLIIKIIAPDK